MISRRDLKPPTEWVTNWASIHTSPCPQPITAQTSIREDNGLVRTHFFPQSEYAQSEHGGPPPPLVIQNPVKTEVAVKPQMSSIASIPEGSPSHSYDLTSDPNFMHMLSNMIAQTLQSPHSNIVPPRTINMQSTF